MGKSGVEGFDPQRLREARLRAGLTQQALAEKLVLATRPDSPVAGGDAMTPEMVRRAGQDVTTVRLQIIGYEDGSTQPRAPMLYQLAQALGVDVFGLLDPATPLNLVTQRVRLGLVQADVVEQGLGVTRAYYGRVERGKAKLGDDDRRRLADILNLTTEELERSIDGAATVGSVLSS